MLSVMPASLYSQCLIKTDNYRLVCADEVRYADSIASGTRLYISSRNAYVSSPRSIFNLVEGYGQYFFKVTNSANSQKIAVGRKWVTRIDSTGAGKALIYIRDINVTFTTTESYTAVVDSAIACFQRAVSSGLATLSDGDYGDVVVSGGGLVMTVDRPDLGLHNLADGDFSVTADSTALSLTGTRQITLQTQNIDGWISRYLQTNNSLTLRTNSTGKNSRIFVDTTGANFQFVNGANNASLRVGDSIAVRFNTSGSVGQVLTVTSIDGDGRLVINPKAGGSGTANCEQTLTKNSHGFSKWTPIYWNGSTWARPTYDSIIPSYIVIDSTSANTFKVANCGNYSSSLTSGVYYYTGTSPGYTLTQPEIKVPLFEVVQSRLILQPLIGFQLAGGGGAADGNGIYSGSDSLSQENTYAAMAADGSQTFGIGYFPSFPDYDYSENEYGFYQSPDYGSIAVMQNKKDAIHMYNGSMEQFSGRTDIYDGGAILLDWTRLRTNVSLKNGSNVSVMQQDTIGLFFQNNSTGGDTLLRILNSGKFNLGHWPAFPNRDYDYNTEYGLFANIDYGEVTLANKGSYLALYDNNAYLGRYRDGNSIYGEINIGQNNKVTAVVGKLNDEFVSFTLDTLGFEFTDNIGAGGNYRFPLPSVSKPSITSGAISDLIWTAGTPSFLRSQHGVVTETTDGSGDLTVTFAAAMPDATYTLIATIEGTTSYTISVHTKATGTCKVRFFNPATGAAVTATSVTLSYEAKDY